MIERKPQAAHDSRSDVGSVATTHENAGPPELLIREGLPDDVAAMFDIRGRVDENRMSRSEFADLGITEDRIRNRLGAELTAWVAEIDGQVVGYSMSDRERGCVYAVFVLTNFQRRGIGAALLDRASASLFSRGFDPLFLNTDASTGAHRFYLRRGWTDIGKCDAAERRLELSAELWADLRRVDETRGEIDEPVEILDYDERWPSWYLFDAQELRREFGERLHDLQHFGSTSVPHLSAKPIIDILVAPESWPLGASERALFEKLGYEYLGEAGVAGREYLRRRTNHATNLAVVQKAGALWDDNIVVRDYLLAHADIAASYVDLKRAIWTQGARSLLEYSHAKHDFVNELLIRARRWRDGA
jgi:GrpB-like predicted nucleotidyltransferase (UPF0157 family)/GNAT superfamily N-acetyltransferase